MIFYIKAFEKVSHSNVDTHINTHNYVQLGHCRHWGHAFTAAQIAEVRAAAHMLRCRTNCPATGKLLLSSSLQPERESYLVAWSSRDTSQAAQRPDQEPEHGSGWSGLHMCWRTLVVRAIALLLLLFKFFFATGMWPYGSYHARYNCHFMSCLGMSITDCFMKMKTTSQDSLVQWEEKSRACWNKICACQNVEEQRVQSSWRSKVKL